MQWIFVIKKSWFIPFYFISLSPSLPSLTSSFFTSLGVSIPIFYFLILYGYFSLWGVVWCGVIVRLDFCRAVAKKTKKNRTAALLSFWFFVSPLWRKTGKNLTNLYTNSFIFFCPLFIPITMPCPVIFFSAKLFFICYFKIQSENTFLQLFFLSCDG